jgi:RNA polymerase sigma factor (sigma-70 family)
MARALPHWDQIESSPMAYVRRSMINIRLNDRRRQQPQPLPPETMSGVADDEQAVVERVRLEHILGGLDAMERAVLVLRFLQDMPTRAVAQELACSSVTVSRLVRRALASARALDEEPAHDQRRSAR